MRIGIVNDLALAREALRRVVQSSDSHEVAWLAADGAEAVAAAQRDTPDLILMDLIMPGVDGAEATRRIMAETPCPILVVTATVHGNFGKVYEAMGNGALDAVDTPTLGPGGAVTGGEGLLAKIGTVAKLIGKPIGRTMMRVADGPPSSRPPLGEPLVVIGASTGGPSAVAEVLSAFPKVWKAAVIVIQHVDSAFADGLARWLGERSGRKVEVAREGDRPGPGEVLVAGTNDHLVFAPGAELRYVAEPMAACFRPSVDVFLGSAALHWPSPGVAVILTGMGRDGAVGMLTLRSAGWHTIAQDEATSVVWGMPRAAVECGAAREVLPISSIGPAVVDYLLNLASNDEASR